MITPANHYCLLTLFFYHNEKISQPHVKGRKKDRHKTILSVLATLLLPIDYLVIPQEFLQKQKQHH